MKPMTLTGLEPLQEADCRTTVESGHVLFSCEGLNVHYGNERALDNIELRISSNRIFALMGPSGCGKTTLLYTMSGLLPHIADARMSGMVRFDGKDMYSNNPAPIAVRKRIGFVFQKPSPFPFSIYRNLELVLKEHGVKNPKEIEAKIEAALKRVGLWSEVKDRLHKPALALSGGQQQRLCIARALVLKPKVLLMDEPCSALDPISSGVIEELIAELGHSHSVILVTHNLAQAKRISQDAALFWVKDGAGVLVESGSTDQVFHQPSSAITAAYITGVKG